jgi:lysyl-tRNA synthetase class I
MRGKKTDNETIYKIMISMFSTNNAEETARLLEIPVTTVKDIYKKNENKPEFVELRSKKTDQFIQKANEIIDKAMERLLEELKDKENRIPVNNLSTVIGTLVDKRNLAEGKATVNTEINIKMDKKVEELSQ